MNPNFATNYMWAAYAAVWIIHLSYLLWLWAQSQQLQAEVEEANRG